MITLEIPAQRYVETGDAMAPHSGGPINTRTNAMMEIRYLVMAAARLARLRSGGFAQVGVPLILIPAKRSAGMGGDLNLRTEVFVTMATQ
jgi:hypothetical protein